MSPTARLETPVPHEPSFFVLLGIDGSGKTSTLKALQLPRTVTVSWQDLRSHEVPAMLAPGAPTQIRNRIPPLARAMFIGGHLVAQYEYLVRPELEAGNSVVLDSYYYKLLAKERLFGVADPSFEQLCLELPRPHGAVFIDVDWLTAYARKGGALSPYEYIGPPGEVSFGAFQSALRSLVLEQLDAVPHVVVEGNQPIASLVHAVAEAFVELHGRRTAGRCSRDADVAAV